MVSFLNITRITQTVRDKHWELHLYNVSDYLD